MKILVKPKLFSIWLGKEGLWVIPPPEPKSDVSVPPSHNYPWSSLDYHDHHPLLTHPPPLQPKTDRVCFISHVIVICFSIPLSLSIFFAIFLDLKIILVVNFSYWLRICCIEIIRTIFYLLWSIGYGFNCIVVRLDVAAVYFLVNMFDFARFYCGISFRFCEISYARIAIFVKLTVNKRKLCNIPYEQLSIFFSFFFYFFFSSLRIIYHINY